MGYPQWVPPSDPTDDDGLLGPSRFSQRALALLRPDHRLPRNRLMDVWRDDVTETASVQEDEIDADPSASPGENEPVVTAAGHSRLLDFQSLAPQWEAYLPPIYSAYETAVSTGFAPFEWGSYSPLFKQAYVAIHTGDPGEGDPIEEDLGEGLFEVEGQTQDHARPRQVKRTVGTERYEAKIVSDNRGQELVREIKVTDSANHQVKLYSLTTTRESWDHSTIRRLKVSLPQYGIYQMSSDSSSLDVVYRSSFETWGPTEYEYHLSNDGGFVTRQGGHVPNWQGPTELPDP